MATTPPSVVQNLVNTAISIGNSDTMIQKRIDGNASASTVAAVNEVWQAAWDAFQPTGGWGQNGNDLNKLNDYDQQTNRGVMKQWVTAIATETASPLIKQDVLNVLNMPATKVSMTLATDWHGEGHGDTRLTSAVPIIETKSVESQITRTINQTSTEWVDTSHWVDQITNQEQQFINDSSVPKMRQKATLVYATGLKPFTKMYAYMDGVNLSASCVKAIDYIVSNSTGNFLGVKEIPVASDSPQSRTFDAYNTIWPFGEIVDCTGGNTLAGQSAVVVAHYTRMSSANVAEEVVVILCNQGRSVDSLTPGFTIKGRKSGATATVTQIKYWNGQMNAQSGNFEGGEAGTTDSLGNLFTRLYIPSNRFDTGAKTISLVDKADGNYETSITKGKGTLFAQGTQHNFVNIITHRNFWESSGYNQTVVTQVEKTETVVNKIDNLVGYDMKFEINDPLSQTFTLPDGYPNGAMVHSVDLYFYQNNDTLPVTVQLTGTTNGYPNTEVYATTTLLPSQIKASPTSLVATRVNFYKLVFLEPNKEYAIKILSNSNKYKLWVAKTGEIDIATRKLITKQASTGSLFMSQNNSTWTADQFRDLVFKLNVAKFDTTATGVVDLYPLMDKKQLPSNPFYLTNTSTRVRVTHYNHGFVAGNFVTFSGATGTLGTQFNSSFKIESVANSDSYTINIAAAATSTQTVGGGSVSALAQNRFDMMRLYVNSYAPTATSLTASIKTTDSSMTLGSAYSPVPINTYWYMSNPSYILSQENELKLLNGAKSFTYQMQMTSSNSAFSPLIDISTIGVVAGLNRTSYNTLSDVGSKIFDTEDVSAVVASGMTAVFSLSNKTLTATAGNFDALAIGKYIKVSGSTSNNGVFLITGLDKTNKIIYLDSSTLANETTTTATVVQYDLVTSGIAPTGDLAEGVYVTIPINLKNQSTGLKIIMDSAIPSGTYLDVYYRAKIDNSTAGLIDSNWTLINKSVTNDESFLERQYDALKLAPFSSFQIKIVMRSDNTSKVARAKNLRIIAVA